MDIAIRLQKIKDSLPAHVTLAAVSKYHPCASIEQAYAAGQRIFAESRAQELLDKQTTLPADIQWHFIGHLQTNKVKSIVPFIDLIQSVDSLHLLQEINKQAQRIDRPIRVLLQVHIAQEEHKFGFTPEEVPGILQQDFSHIHFCGLMGMATFSDDDVLISSEFSSLRSLFDTIRNENQIDKSLFSICSCGMSDDYPLAIAQGSNMVRVGSAIFGSRQ